MKNKYFTLGITLMLLLSLQTILVSPVDATLEEHDISVNNIISTYNLLNEYDLFDPIRINEDADFETQGWDGDGTFANPYIIEGYEIDGGGVGNCIYIGNTTVHFKIRNNFIHNASGNSGDFFRNSGIYLHEVTNGTIIGNIGYNNANHGIYLESSKGNVLEGNKMYENRRGIKLIGESDENIIKDNVANNNTFGINIRETSSHNLVVNNTVIGNERGIYVNVEVNDRLITNTTIIGNTINHNIDTSWNSGYGISVRSNHFTRRIQYTTVENNTLDGNDIGIYIFRPTYNTVSNNEVKNSTSTGIWFGRSDNNIVINNTAINNSGRGFYISRITSSDFINNTAINNSNDGIHIIGDHDGWDTIPTTGNTITGSIVKNNEGHGIYMDGYTRSNTYTHNTIQNNTGSGFYLTNRDFDHTRNNRIENNIISLNGEHGIYMYESRLNELLNNTMLGNGIYIEGTNVNRWNTHTIDTNNTVDGKPVHYFKDAVGGVVPTGAGQVILADCDGTTVENQEFSNATLLLGYSEDIEIINVTVSEPYLHGVFIYHSHQCSITESTFVNAGVSGIYASLSDDPHIDKTSVIGSGASGIHLSNSHRGIVDDTSIFYAPDLAGTGDGLEVEGSNNAVITDNTIFSNYRGIYIHMGSTDHIISRNHLFDNNDGLHLNDAGAGQLIYGNNVSYNDRHGIYISSSGENIIENNTIESNNDDGIHIRSSVSWIVNNLLADNGNDGVYIQRTANGHLINNTILNSGRRGLWSRGATGWQIVYNNISGYNDNYGISKWSSSGTGTPFIQTGGHLIANNIVTGGGIYILHPSQPSTIEGNTITDYSDRGIRLDQGATSYSSTKNVVENNTLTAHPESTEATGIFVSSGCSETDIENNTIEDGRDGINMGSNDNSAQFNTVRNVTRYGLRSSGQNNRIEDNTVLNSHYGFYLSGSDHSVVDNTILNSSLHGVYTYDLQDTLVKNNTIDGTQDNGIEIYFSSNLEVYNNTIFDSSQHGIHLSSANSCVLKGNAMHGTGIMMSGWDVSNWKSHTIYENNTVNDLPVIYLTSLTDGSVSGNVGQVIIADCADMMISNLTIENSGVALLLGFSDDNTIVNSTFVNNTYGIYLYSSNGNLIYHNNFINNMIQAHDNGINVWDSGYPSGGNHWSDWIGPDEYSGPEQDEAGSDGIVDEPREIEGGDSEDRYPWTLENGWSLEGPSVILSSPTGGEEWVMNTDNHINWTVVPGDGAVTGVDIDFSLDGGDTWTSIVIDAPDTGTYIWTVSGDVTSEAIIRIYVHDENHRMGSDMSGLFSIISTPSVPENFDSTGGDEEVILDWDTPTNDGGSEILEYILYWGIDPSELSNTITLPAAEGTSYIHEDRTNGITYYYRISAVNNAGEGDLSEMVHATPATTPSSPQNLEAIPGDGYVLLNWEEPLSDGGLDITNYTIYRGLTSGELTALTTIDAVLNYTDEDVINGEIYFYQVRAVNDLGPGELSEEVDATPAAVPSAPQNLQATSGDGQVLLIWDEPISDGGCDITNYTIYRGTSTGELTWFITIGPVLNYTDQNVTNGITYFYQISAVNSAGEGHLSDEISSTPRTVPTSPLNFSGTAGDEQVILSWDAPSDDGGSPILEYRIYRGFNSGDLSFHQSVDADQTTYTDIDLTNGVTYYHQISAVNLVGESELSDEISTIPATTPSAPENLQLTPDDREILLVWEPPSSDGGTTITNYIIYRGENSGDLTHLITVGDVHEYIDGDVVNGITYYYRVSAVNLVGEGDLSDEVSATPATTPSAPQNLEATAGDEQVFLRWDEPLSDGGGVITNYNIYRGTTSEDIIHLATINNILEFTDEDVTNGLTYYYRVSAVNWAGEGDLSVEVSATPASTPSAPENVRASAGEDEIVLDWDEPISDGGFAITNYNIYRGSTELTLIATIGNVLEYTDEDVTIGVTYSYKIAAVNALGEGKLSEEVSATVLGDITEPSAPNNLEAIADDEEITLTWDPPTDDGGSVVIEYKIYRGTTSADLSLQNTVSGDSTIFTDISVTNGVTYHYRISAVNVAGEGPLSNEVSATPATTPSTPMYLQSIAGDGIVYLEWSVPSYDGGAEITNYRIYRGTTSGDLTLLKVVDNILEYNDEDVTNGITYYYQVSAVNWAGEGDLSDETTATPITVPSAPQNLEATAGDERVILRWDEPSSDGGSEIINYRIYRGTTSGRLSLLTVVGDVLEYNDEAVTNGMIYYYRIIAVNAAGEGATSDEVNAMPYLEGFSPIDLILDVSPTAGESPLEVNITISAYNEGNTGGYIDLTIDGDIVYSLFVPAGNSSHHSFNHTFDELGEYLIGFEELSQLVTVSGTDDDLPPDDDDDLPPDDDDDLPPDDDDDPPSDDDDKEDEPATAAGTLSKYWWLIFLPLIISIGLFIILKLGKEDGSFGKELEEETVDSEKDDV